MDRLSGEAAKVLAIPVVNERLTAGGMEPVHTGAEKMAAQMRSDYAESLEDIKTANIEMEE